jgi:hypothetical protein
VGRWTGGVVTGGSATPVVWVTGRRWVGISGSPGGQHAGAGRAAMNPAPPARVGQAELRSVACGDPTRPGDTGIPPSLRDPTPAC